MFQPLCVRAGKSISLLIPVVLAVVMHAGPAQAQHDHGSELTGTSGAPRGVPGYCGSPTITSTSSGAWSSPSTWSGNRVPGAGDKVSIAAGNTVTYDRVSDGALDCISVDGALQFRVDINTRMTVGTVLVRPAGSLEIGRENAPVAASVTAEVIFADKPIDTSFDPEQLGNGLIGLGRIRIHGAAKTSFVRLAGELAAGQSALTMSQAVSGWQPGDRLLVPDTRELPMANLDTDSYVGQYETRPLASASGTSASLAAALAFSHIGARNADGVLEFLPHVGNLSRNVIFRSENPNGTRGHTIFMHRADVDIRYAQFSDLGRTRSEELHSTAFGPSDNVTVIGTNQIGRYPVHLHHVMGPVIPPSSGFQFVLIGNSVENTLKWAVTVHNTHYGLVRENVVYNGTSSGIVTEDGTESFNVIERNFVVRMLGQGGNGALGREGSGYWFRGVNNYVRDNVAANIRSVCCGADGLGFNFAQAHLPETIRVPTVPGADTSVSGQYVTKNPFSLPILQFADNEVYGASEGGITYYWIGTRWNDPRPDAQTSVLKNLRVWHHSGSAVVHYPAAKLVIDGLVVRARSPETGSGGVSLNDYMAHDITIRNADLQGLAAGIYPSSNTANGLQTIENSYLRNRINILVDSLWDCCSIENTTARRVVINNVRFESIPGYAATSEDIQMRYRTDFVTLVKRDEVFVFNYNQIPGNNFRVYYTQQAPSFVMPQTVFSGARMILEGSPSAGLTNSQAWATFGIAIAGAVAPCQTTRQNISGFACPTNDTAPPPVVTQGPPSAPSGVRIIGQ